MQRILAVLVVLLLAAGGVGYLLLERQRAAALAAAESACSQRLEAERERAAAVAEEMALDLARVLALGLADEVGRGDSAALDELLAGAVRGKRLVEVIVLGPSREVLSSTDLRWRGRTLDDAGALKATAVGEVTALEDDGSGRFEVASPVEVGGVRVATVRAFFEPGV